MEELSLFEISTPRQWPQLSKSDFDSDGQYNVYGANGIVGKSNKYNHIEETILIACRGVCGSISLTTPYSYTTNNAIALDNINYKKVNKKYLFFYLKSYNFSHLITGTAQKQITLQNLKRVIIKIPNLDEQQRIVTILDKIETVLSKRRNVQLKQEILLKSLFYNNFREFFSKSNSNSTLIEYADIISGITKGKNYKDKSVIEIPYLRVANVQDGYLDLSEIKKISATENEIKKYTLLYNDLLLTEGGDPDKLGRGFLWRNEIEGCIFQNHLFRVRIKDTNKLSPIFLTYLVSSAYGKAYFLKSARQTTGIATINSSHVKNFPVFIPSIELQNSFSKQALKLEKMINLNNNQIEALETLLKAIAQLAFEGKLKSNIAVNLEALLQEDYFYFKNNSNKKTIELLLERLDKDILNQKKFNDIQTYDKAKNFVLQLLRDKMIVQVFDESKKTLKLALK